MIFKFTLNNLLIFQSSPPPMSPNGRSQDIDAIVNVIEKAEKFVHISVMDFFPVSLYTPKPKCVDFQYIFLGAFNSY